MIAIAVLLLAASAGPDLTSKQAVEVARRFLVAAKLPAPSNPLTVRRQQYGDMFGSWEVADNGNYSISIGEGSAMVTGFSNSRRQYEIAKKVNRTGKRRFSNEKAARAYVMLLAKDLGLPKEAVLNDFRFGTAQGEIYAQWTDKPFGYPGLNASYIALDMQDGALKSYYSRWGVRTSKPTIKVPKATAEKTAERAYKAGPSHLFHSGPLNPRLTTLRWVLPNGSYTSHPYRPPGPSPVARLVYQVYFGGNSVWVDAETGQVVGGMTLK